MNKQNFTLMIKTFSEVYERSLNPYVIEIYFDLFKEIPDSQVRAITKNCLRKCKYFPRPADIFEQLSETPEKYVFKQEPKLTPEQVKKNLANNKAIMDKLNNKFKMPEEGKTIRGENEGRNK